MGQCYVVTSISHYATLLNNNEDVDQILLFSLSKQSIGALSRQANFLSPIQVKATFNELPRPSPTYMNGSPVVLVDYRDIPRIVMEGNNTVSVSYWYPSHSV